MFLNLFFKIMVLSVATNIHCFMLTGSTVQEQTELIDWLPHLPVGGSTFYTPPHINTFFPQITDKPFLPKLHIAGTLPTEGDELKLSNLKWSHPIDLLVAADNFISLPGVADVKVHVHKIAMVTNVTVSPITKADVSAKEIRSRLKGKERTITVTTPTEIKDVKKDIEHIFVAKSKLDASMSEKKAKRNLKQMSKVSCGIFATDISFVLLDETTSVSKKQETIRLNVKDLYMATYPVSDLEEHPSYHRNCLVLSCGNAQLDNQMDYKNNFDFPVVFVRQEFKQPFQNASADMQLSQMNVLEKHAVLKSVSLMHAQIVLGQVEGRKSVIETVDCSMQPMNVYVDDTFVFEMIKQVGQLVPVPLSHPAPVPPDIYKLPKLVRNLSCALSNPVVIGHLSVQPIKALVSVHASMKVFIAADETPLSFGKFERLALCTSSYQLTRALAMHYASGALFRAGKSFKI